MTKENKTPEPNVRQMSRGNVLFFMKKVGRQILGEERLKEVIDNLSPESKKVYTELIESDNWYPTSAVAELLDIGVKMVGQEIVLKIVREAAKKEMNTSYKIIMRLFVSPQKLAENNKKLWDSMQNSGKFEVTINEPKTHTIEISEYDFINDAYRLMWAEYHAAIVSMTGAKNVKYLALKATDRYIFKFTWD
jgi:hypothetical protein